MGVGERKRRNGEREERQKERGGGEGRGGELLLLKGHGHGSESPHTSSVYRLPISLMRRILKTGQVFKIRGGIPISAASVGGWSLAAR